MSHSMQCVIYPAMLVSLVCLNVTISYTHTILALAILLANTASATPSSQMAYLLIYANINAAIGARVSIYSIQCSLDIVEILHITPNSHPYPS